MFDWTVVGAGFTGATFAERMAAAGKRVLVIDGRNHVGGNAYDHLNSEGILVHKYGPHIFHTNSSMVWGYLSRFTEWRSYEHRVQGHIDDQLVPIPFNLTSLERLFKPDEASSIKTKLVAAYGYDKKVPILELRQSDDPEIRDFADFVYKKVFEGYTIKQWALTPEQLSSSVTSRVPVLIGHDDRYFQDTFQAMPRDGYTALFKRLLDHPNITVQVGVDFNLLSAPTSPQVLYTGAIDELLDYRFGALPYRSLRFEETTYPVPRMQTTGTVNYPNDNNFTRISEMTIITGQQADRTTLIKEYPLAHVPRETIAYYPIPQPQNQELYTRYAACARTELPHIVVAGRLGDYQYYNMDQACARGMTLASRFGGEKWETAA